KFFRVASQARALRTSVCWLRLLSELATSRFCPTQLIRVFLTELATGAQRHGDKIRALCFTSSLRLRASVAIFKESKTMAHKQVLLREDIDNLGARGEIVRVKAGYARNYLLPRSLAVEATDSNVKQIESERAALLKREAKERSTADAQAEQLRGMT